METNKKSKIKIIALLIAVVVVVVGALLIIHFIRQSAAYLTTDNARVTTNLIAVNPDIPGTLERFTIAEGSYVTENQVLGWVENGEPLRSPVDGLVLYAGAVQEQMVSPHESIAVIADKNNIRIQANISETDITELYRGQPAFVTIDTFGNRQFEGYISEIGRITTAELSGQSVFFNTGGTFTRVTHLIPIEITLNDDAGLYNFVGVNARVRIPLGGSDTVIPVSANVNTQSDRILVGGAVESVKSRNVYSMLDFRIDSVDAKVGDYVEKGQVLAVLDTGDLELMITQHKVELGTMRQSDNHALNESRRLFNEAAANIDNNTNIGILNAQSAVNAAEINLRAAQRNHDDIFRDRESEQFVRQQAIHEVEMATIAFDDAQVMLNAAVAAAWQELEMFRSNVTAAEIAVNLESTQVAAGIELLEITIEMLENQLERAVIKSPISGTVTSVFASEGAIGAGLLFVVEDMESLRIMTSVREHDISRIYEGMEVIITADSNGNAEYTGVISRISPAAKVDSPIVEFEVEVIITSDKVGLRIGVSARVEIFVREDNLRDIA
jgi:multidrug resistance efflux pump